MDIIEDRNHHKTTIFCSQLPVKAWHDLFSEKTIAEYAPEQPHIS